MRSSTEWARTTPIYRDAQGDGYPLRVAHGKMGKLKEETDFLIEQIRTVHNRRLMREKPLAELPGTHMKRVEEALRILTGE